VERLRHIVHEDLRRKGAVVGISGGIDSAVVTFLCARAFGPEHTLGLLMPERHSSEDTLRLSRGVAEAAGVQAELEEITPLLDAAGCYRRQEEAIKLAVPEFRPGCKFKIVLPSVIEDDRLRLFYVTVVFPDGTEVKRRLPLEANLSVVAATNFKQRCRTMLEYYHADRLNYAVAGTPNRLEYDQGFFVKGGDGLADFKPIAHLYKSQVYQLAAYLGVPEEVRRRPPTTDTYSLPQGQDEFYFSLPYDQMDLCLFARNQGLPPSAVTSALGITEEQVGRVFRDIDHKRRTTRYLHLGPQLVEPVEGLEL
jgi:NAD+ synthase